MDYLAADGLRLRLAPLLSQLYPYLPTTAMDDMQLVSTHLYRALVAAEVPDELATAAAADFARTDARLTTIARDVRVLQWMTGACGVLIAMLIAFQP